MVVDAEALGMWDSLSDRLLGSGDRARVGIVLGAAADVGGLSVLPCAGGGGSRGSSYAGAGGA